MKVLAVDTSTTVATAAVIDNSTLIAEYTINNKRAHSQKLITLIEAMLADCGVSIADIDIFACSSGPGSFTGLRIGAATIKGMAQALKKPVVGVPTLDALAYNLFNSKDLICPILDAQRGMVYAALYMWEAGVLVKKEDFRVISIDELINKLADQAVTFLGDGVLLYEKEIKERLQKATIAPQSHLMPHGASCGQLALKLFSEDKYEDYHSFRPTYIRKSQAEVEFEKKQEIIIDEMKLADIDDICEIEELSFKTPWSRASFVTELEDNNLAKYVVARAEGETIGYGGMWQVFDEGHITNIAVHPDYRGRGIGEKIVLALIEAAYRADIERMTLEVRPSNVQAINLYKKLGFDDYGRRKGYYSDTGEDALIMWKVLS